jgi:3-oxoacyl-[acyl-carrier-protein] synthase III
VLEGIGKGLKLRPEHLAPSLAVLHDYGNVSSSSTWYTLAHVETLGGVKKGEKVMQVRGARGWCRQGDRAPGRSAGAPLAGSF